MTEIVNNLFIWIGVIFYGLILIGGPFFIICYIVAHIVNIFKQRPDPPLPSDEEIYTGGGC